VGRQLKETVANIQALNFGSLRTQTVVVPEMFLLLFGQGRNCGSDGGLFGSDLASGREYLLKYAEELNLLSRAATGQQG
jgi:hypothetical protein